MILAENIHAPLRHIHKHSLRLPVCHQGKINRAGHRFERGKHAILLALVVDPAVIACTRNCLFPVAFSSRPCRAHRRIPFPLSVADRGPCRVLRPCAGLARRPRPAENMAGSMILMSSAPLGKRQSLPAVPGGEGLHVRCSNPAQAPGRGSESPRSLSLHYSARSRAWPAVSRKASMKHSSGPP